MLYLTMLGRDCPETPFDTAFADEERKAVYLDPQRKPPPDERPLLDILVRMVSSLGGSLDRKYDGFSLPNSLQICLQRAADFVLALEAQRSFRGS